MSLSQQCVDSTFSLIENQHLEAINTILRIFPQGDSRSQSNLTVIFTAKKIG